MLFYWENIMAKDLCALVQQQWQTQCAGHHAIEVGLSGGLDSVVLLHILVQLRERLGLQLTAVHIHHGLQAQADDWVPFCEQYCAAWHVPLRVERVDVNTQGVGVEAGARHARYQVFSTTSATIIALAHHADDQVETFMLAALRGGGLRALAAMPSVRALNERVQVWRPLLGVSRAALQLYAQQYGLAYVDDPSNEDGAYLRNWLRHQGLPAWQTRVPHLKRHVLSSIALLQDELAVLEEVVASDRAMIEQQGWFDCQRWRTLSQARRQQQLVHFVQTQGLGQPSRAAVQDFERVLWALDKGSAQWQLPHGEIQVYQQRLFALPQGWQQAILPTAAQGCLRDILTPQLGWQFKITAYGLPDEIWATQGAIRTVQADDVLPLATGRKNVLKLLQEWKVPPFMRSHWVVITDERNRCLAVPNIWVDARLAVKGGILPIWQALQPFVLQPK